MLLGPFTALATVIYYGGRGRGQAGYNSGMEKEEPKGRDEGGSELARDVRLLGNALGDVLREQGGEALLQTVERIRALTKEARSRQGQDDAEA